VTVVQDDPSLLALYWPAGTPSKGPENRLTPQQLLSSEQIVLVDRKWVDTDVLMLVTPGAAHAVYVMWEMGQSSLRCWYIDLQEPLRRTPVGFDTRDHILDIVISADRSEWKWKDEDEFREAVAIGLFSRDEALSIRMEGERVISMMQSGASPFCDGWEKWSPPEEWGIPAFPLNWSNITI
jgi:predicted RNA-binding protein associated with RNAse of E/G family